jgi:hypothetical protein
MHLVYAIFIKTPKFFFNKIGLGQSAFSALFF